MQTGSELDLNKFLLKIVYQNELLNLFNRGSDRLSSGLDLTDFGWGGWRMGVLDGIMAISAQLEFGFGLSLATSNHNSMKSSFKHCLLILY